MGLEVFAGSAARQGMISASGYQSSYVPTKAFDGSTITYWVSQASACLSGSPYTCTGLWFQFNFGAAKEIRQVRMHSHGTYELPGDIDVYVSDTGAFAGEESFVCTVSYSHPGDTLWGDWAIFAASASAQYIRFVVNAHTGTYAGRTDVRVKEIELMEYIATIPLVVALEQAYGTGPVDTALEQRCGLYVDAALEQLYLLMYGATAALEQRCGLYLDAALSQRYGDAAAPAVALYQYYGDTSLPAVALVQEYDDALLSAVALEQEYHLMYESVAGLVQEYAICEGLLSKALEQIYSLKDLDPVTVALKQAYGLLGDPARSAVCGIAVVADDQVVDPWQVEVAHDLGSYISKCTVHLRSHAQWQSIQRLGDLQVYDGTITYSYFIEAKPRARTLSEAGMYEADYQLVGLSKTAALDVPYAVPVTMEWASGGMASEIAEDLVDLAGVGLMLDWRIVDWRIGADLFFLADETPLSGLRRLIANRGVLQTDTDGVTLIIKAEDEVSPVNYAAATATDTPYTLTDEYDFTAASDQPKIHPLYNSVLVSDQLASTTSGWRIEDEAVSETESLVRVYRTPWGGTWTLRTSGGAWVTIEDLGVVTETITEQVEFVDGVGRTSKPVYAQVSLSWLQTSLGGIIFSEAGQLVATVAGNSLAEFAYTTKYRKYRVRSDRVGAVQFYVEEGTEA